MPTRPRTFRPRGRPTGQAAERIRDQERRTAFVTRKLYNTARWRGLRAAELAAEPLCCMCLDAGVTTIATVRDHVEPHRGDVDKFWNGERQSLCKPHHDRDKQRLEASAAEG